MTLRPPSYDTDEQEFEQHLVDKQGDRVGSLTFSVKHEEMV